MNGAVTLARRSYSMWRSDDPRETWIAAGLAAVAAGLMWWRFGGRRR
jgi:hypothetical protein